MGHAYDPVVSQTLPKEVCFPDTEPNCKIFLANLIGYLLQIRWNNKPEAVLESVIYFLKTRIRTALSNIFGCSFFTNIIFTAIWLVAKRLLWKFHHDIILPFLLRFFFELLVHWDSSNFGFLDYFSTFRFKAFSILLSSLRETEH